MLFKHLLPKCPAYLRNDGKSTSTLWHYTAKRYGYKDSYRASLLSEPTDMETELEWGSYYNKDSWHQEYFTCRPSAGDQHSPINIVTKRTIFRSTMPFKLTSYDKANMKLLLSNNGNVVKAIFPEDTLSLTAGGLTYTYNADHLHFHWGKSNREGSEHYQNGDSFPMEMHIVHYNSMYPHLEDAESQPSSIVVLAFLFELSAHKNKAWRVITDSLTEIVIPFQTISVELPSLLSLLPKNLNDFYQYSDSYLTGFPTITWIVFKDKIKISESQLEKFRKLQSASRDPNTDKIINLGDNFRDPVDIPELQVYSSFVLSATDHKKQGSSLGRLIYNIVCGGRKRKRSHVY